MATKKSTTTGYQFPDYPDDPTLGGAITAEMRDALEASATGGPAEPTPEPAG